jgi:hypothetical protein
MFFFKVPKLLFIALHCLQTMTDKRVHSRPRNKVFPQQLPQQHLQQHPQQLPQQQVLQLAQQLLVIFFNFY